MRGIEQSHSQYYFILRLHFISKTVWKLKIGKISNITHKFTSCSLSPFKDDHFFCGFIGDPGEQLNTSENLFEFWRIPITL